LPGAQIHGYQEDPNLTAATLAARYQLFAVQVPLQEAGCDTCKILGQRLDIRSRQSDSETRELLNGKVMQFLFVKELLVESAGANPAAANEEGCR
jgi:hypothetical protein